ncbi:MAG: 16S rRNA (guanine(966)-N(2))-methyltransferase RsmD, partial [Bacilli bacterium]
MRIISGKYKGKILSGHGIDGTRPTMDRVRESLIATVQTNLKNSIVLDLFAGTGSVSFEMISNGCKQAYLVDKNPLVVKTLKKNILELSPDEEIIIINSDFKDALKEFNRKNIKFDIVFLDPPYKLDFINPSIELLIKYNLLKDGSIVICESEFEEVKNFDLEIYKEKKYGSKKVII